MNGGDVSVGGAICGSEAGVVVFGPISCFTGASGGGEIDILLVSFGAASTLMDGPPSGFGAASFETVLMIFDWLAAESMYF